MYLDMRFLLLNKSKLFVIKVDSDDGEEDIFGFHHLNGAKQVFDLEWVFTICDEEGLTGPAWLFDKLLLLSFQCHNEAINSYTTLCEEGFPEQESLRRAPSP